MAQAKIWLNLFWPCRSQASMELVNGMAEPKRLFNLLVASCRQISQMYSIALKGVYNNVS